MAKNNNGRIKATATIITIVLILLGWVVSVVLAYADVGNKANAALEFKEKIVPLLKENNEKQDACIVKNEKNIIGIQKDLEYLKIGQVEQKNEMKANFEELKALIKDGH